MSKTDSENRVGIEVLAIFAVIGIMALSRLIGHKKAVKVGFLSSSFRMERVKRPLLVIFVIFAFIVMLVMIDAVSHPG